MTGTDAKGKVLIGGTSGPLAKTLSGAGDVSITNGNNTITIGYTHPSTSFDKKVKAGESDTNYGTTNYFINGIETNNTGHLSKIPVAKAVGSRADLSIDTDDCVEFGGISVGTSTCAAGEIRAAGDITAFYAASDQALKTNVETIDNALDIVNNLRGVRFEYNDNAKEINPNIDDKKYIGVIAQEVEPHLPEVIRESVDERYLGVRYENMTAVLIEAVKTLSKRVEELESQLK